MGLPKIKGTAEERFFAKVAPASALECWIWKGSKTKKGYGTFWFQGRPVFAHRWAYEFLRGEIPEGLMLDHEACETPACVNPYHLEPVDNDENQRRSTKTNKYKTHCVQGHPLAGDNLYPRSYTRQRMCIECARKRSREYQQRKRQEKRAA